jgi:hypothetical protein
MSECASRKLKHIKVPKHNQKSNGSITVDQMNMFKTKTYLQRDMSAQPLPRMSEYQYRADDQSSYFITDNGDAIDERSFIQLKPSPGQGMKQSLQSGKTCKSNKSHASLYKRLMKGGGALGGVRLDQTYTNIKASAQ